MASLSTVTDVFEAIVAEGVKRGIFFNLEPKLVALNALFMCHLWSLHARALRSITQNIDEFSEMQSAILLDGLLKGEQAKTAASKRRRAARLAGAVSALS
jgi:hypothetical protein